MSRLARLLTREELGNGAQWVLLIASWVPLASLSPRCPKVGTVGVQPGSPFSLRASLSSLLGGWENGWCLVRSDSCFYPISAAWPWAGHYVWPILCLLLCKMRPCSHVAGVMGTIQGHGLRMWPLHCQGITHHFLQCCPVSSL